MDSAIRFFFSKFKSNWENGGGIPVMSLYASYSTVFRGFDRKDIMNRFLELEHQGYVLFRPISDDNEFFMIYLTDAGKKYFSLDN